MPRAKVAISLQERTLARLDRLVRQDVFPSRSQAIEEAVSEKPQFEKALAEDGMAEDLAEWPEY
jgi:metal-responsive CopG/Arc/MetJ family transcriptional regulator